MFLLSNSESEIDITTSKASLSFSLTKDFMKVEVKSLTPRHLRIVDLSIRGLSHTDIAKELEMSREMVAIVCNSPTFKHEFALRRAVIEEKQADVQVRGDDEVVKTLREGAIAAASKLVGHVDSTDEGISVKSCAEVLDRSGYGRKKEENAASFGPTIIINSEDSRRIVETLEINGNPIEKAG